MVVSCLTMWLCRVSLCIFLIRGLGVGMSRAYGLDPSQGVGFMGQMRGLGVTKDTQDSRRLALLIGETIAKSDAFSKADEVMEAIAGFATLGQLFMTQGLAIAPAAPVKVRSTPPPEPCLMEPGLF